MRSEWRDLQAIDDIEQQIQGVDFLTLPLPTGQHRRSPAMGLLHRQMFDAVAMPLTGDITALAQRKINAINALVTYCTV